ncbi:MAG: squalene/phytoene synthase family protein [Planctomycetaceae bacterium]|jgi:phytoene synthase|nr:squalene/phytoene synthase family protein [Planctomycetaceae bacterium]
MSDYSLQSSIRFCQQFTRSAKSNFVPAFSLLPVAKREAMEIFYAYTRFTDDLVDQPDIDPQSGTIIPTSTRRKLQKLNQWVAVLEATLGSLNGTKPTIADAEHETAFQDLEQQFPGCNGLKLLPALKMIVSRFNIPREPLFHLIDGVESDIEPREFETFEQCADYCHQVATSVGFVSLAIWGTTEPLFSNPVVRAAKACGIAFQWTNILRDLVEDYRNNRIYLPKNELQRYGLTVNQFGSLLDRKSWNEQKKKPKNLSDYDQYAFHEMLQRMETFEENWNKLLQIQFERCEIYYTNAAPLYQLISRDSRRVFGLMWSRYYNLFRKIKNNPLRIVHGRVQLSRFQKLRLLFFWKFLSGKQIKK